ncbi:hypothetical protein Sp245p_22280 (plasmid) [Azospirillum baldaniorum]|nr:hypothetical protein Sp245p_22280 [Azospirillum baldaniorum]
MSRLGRSTQFQLAKLRPLVSIGVDWTVLVQGRFVVMPADRFQEQALGKEKPATEIPAGYGAFAQVWQVK